MSTNVKAPINEPEEIKQSTDSNINDLKTNNDILLTKINELLELVKSQQLSLQKISDAQAAAAAAPQNQSNALHKYEDKIKKEIIEFMLNNLNISWIDDNIERNIYDTIITFMLSIVNKYISL